MTDFDKDTYQTPKYLFNWLNKRFNFDVDGCASDDNRLCAEYIGIGSANSEDFLEPINFPASNIRFYVNPPYSNPLPFVQRAAELKKAGHIVVMLLPADKSTRWYQVIQENASEVIDIIGGRISFINPLTNAEVKGNNKGSMIVVFDPFIEGIVTRQMPLDKIKEWGK